MATQQVEAGAAGHGAEPRGKRGEDGQATYLIAIAEALWEEMERDDRVFMLGEDIGVYGGAFKVTEGFIERFGAERVMDTPIAEETIVGTANSFALGVEYANWLLFTTHTTGRRNTADVLRASCHRPFDVAPSPQIAMAMWPLPARWYASAAPHATG